ncbi:hypothetical protein EGW08_005975 [Elysia chlorotica]|uniref:CIDE-N domain-containing protein n=1 Tax=Elysia chlorotica TaxID=188477 RepID=A0A433TXG3_ELYCH|nr:hypothetical protein EGW08_005975 [Elysia chlorotica]
MCLVYEQNITVEHQNVESNTTPQTCVKLGFEESLGKLRVVLEEDGTEVDDEEYFSFIPPNSTLILLREGECWAVMPPESAGIDETDHGAATSQSKHEDTAAALASDLKKDLSRIITFSNDQLQQLVDADTHNLAQHIGESDRFAGSIQSACQRHLDERDEATETAVLLRLYHKAQQGATPGVKRKMTPEHG